MIRAASVLALAVLLGGCAAVPPAPTPRTRIRDIQGASHRSPLDGQRVAEVAGIVTAVRANGYYVQDPVPDGDDATSDGVYVHTNTAPRDLAVGDEVRIAAAVSEFRPGGSDGRENLTVTQLITPNHRVVGRGRPTPTPLAIGSNGRRVPRPNVDDDAKGDVEVGGQFEPSADAIDFFESIEGMLVRIDDATVVGPRNRFGEAVVIGGDASGIRSLRGGVVIRPGDFNPERVMLDDEVLNYRRLQMPIVDVGDRLSGATVGVVDYTFGNFKVQIAEPPAVVRAARPRTKLSSPAADEVSIASFNVENLHPFVEPSKLTALAELIVQNLAEPDILALEEIQDSSGPANDDTVDARATLDLLVRAIREAGGPVYEWRTVDPQDGRDGGQPGANIHLAYLFRADRGLAFVDRGAADARTATAVQHGPLLSLSPGRVDPTNAVWQNSRKPLAAEVTFRGRKLFLIAAHFLARLGDQPLFGRFQPPELSSEPKRGRQARLVHDFAASILEADRNANVVVLGDLNDFHFSATMSALRGRILHPLIETLSEGERYSYVFDGNSQALDHILVSENLFVRTPFTYTIAHVNADYAERASDHDPQVVRFKLP